MYSQVIPVKFAANKGPNHRRDRTLEVCKLDWPTRSDPTVAEIVRFAGFNEKSSMESRHVSSQAYWFDGRTRWNVGI